MARATLLFERQADASLFPTTVILATPKRLQGKCLPGNPNRDARLTSIIQNAVPPRINVQTEERGSYEDWIDWALNALANGHTTWATEVVPTATVDMLYQREGAMMERGHQTRPPQAGSRPHASLTQWDAANPCA
jgi:hypothetical protein